MLRKPNDVIVTIEVKAKRHETTIAADTMALKNGLFYIFYNFQTKVLLIGVSLVCFSRQLLQY